MALAFRIDNIQSQGGKVLISYTYGTAPLPAEASGAGFETSLAMSNDALAELNFERIMYLALFAIWKAVNPALNNPGLAIGKVITFTPGNASTPMTVV